jgi:hypothetical protein
MSSEQLGNILARLSNCVTIGAPSIMSADKLELAKERGKQLGKQLASIDRELRALLDIPRPDHNCRLKDAHLGATEK